MGLVLCVSPTCCSRRPSVPLAGHQMNFDGWPSRRWRFLRFLTVGHHDVGHHEVCFGFCDFGDKSPIEIVSCVIMMVVMTTPEMELVFFLRVAHDVLPLVLCVSPTCCSRRPSVPWLAINDFLTVGHHNVDGPCLGSFRTSLASKLYSIAIRDLLF